jgi:hypothetical protein
VALPTWDVTKTLSPQVMGEDAPNPASETFQAIFFPGPQLVGSPDSEEMPRLDGPRHCGQSPAARPVEMENVDSARNTATVARRVWTIISDILRVMPFLA